MNKPKTFINHLEEDGSKVLDFLKGLGKCWVCQGKGSIVENGIIEPCPKCQNNKIVKT